MVTRTHRKPALGLRAALGAVSSLLVLTGCGAGESERQAAPSASGTAVPGAGVVGETAECTHPSGFRVSYPADWSVNAGEVLPVCSWFAEESFTVPEASGVRTADVTFSVRVASELPARWPDETSRSRVEVDGRPAVRLEQITTPGLHPVGTPITTYVLDLPAGGDALVARTVGAGQSDYTRNVAVLDAMMASLVLEAVSGV